MEYKWFLIFFGFFYALMTLICSYFLSKLLIKFIFKRSREGGNIAFFAWFVFFVVFLIIFAYLSTFLNADGELKNHFSNSYLYSIVFISIAYSILTRK